MEISVVVPVYNAEAFLHECVDSILNQHFDEFEIILIDDGSTDKSGNICDEYESEYDKIKVIHQKNMGVSAARNTGIKNAKGKYIAFVDADDTITEDYLKKLDMDMAQYGLVACPIKAIGFSEKKELSKEEAQISVLSEKGMKGFPVCKLFDRELLIKEKVFFQEDIAVCEDLLFVEEYLNVVSGRIIWKDACGYTYRKNPKSTLNGRFEKKQFKKKYLTEYEALKRAGDFLQNDVNVCKAWELRKAKAAVTCLRTMIAVDYNQPEFYHELHMQARKYWWKYIRSDNGALSSKMSIVLSAISPKLEFLVWKIFKK